MGIDQQKIEILKTYLAQSFADINSNLQNERYVFNDGKTSYELEWSRAFIDDMPTDRLQQYLDSNNIIQTLKDNPGKSVCISKEGIRILDNKSN